MTVVVLQSCQAATVAALLSSVLGAGWSRASVEEEFSRRGALALGMEMDGQLIAALIGWIVVDELEINVVAVAPAHRAQGLGRTLVEQALERARAVGVLHGFLELRASNAAALALYRRCGFEVFDVRKRYYEDGEDALVMRASLT